MGLFGSKKQSTNAHDKPQAVYPVPPAASPKPPREQDRGATHTSSNIPIGTIAVGIETEFLLKPRDGAPRARIKSLRAFGDWMAETHNENISRPYPRMENQVDMQPATTELHLCWRLVYDISIATTSDGWGIEMLSPIFRLLPGSKWRDTVRGTWGVLRKTTVVNTDEDCSTHVHMSLSGGYSVTQLKRLAQAVIYFEPAFEAILPEDRRGNEYAASNWIDNAYLKRLSRQQAIDRIEQCRTQDELIQLMNPGGAQDRYYGWNFQALNKLSTVEFRRGPASSTADQVLHWVELATTFLRASIHLPSSGALSRLPPNIGGLLHFLHSGHQDHPGLGDSTLYMPLFAGRQATDRLDPKPVGHLSPERLKKFKKKVAFDNARLHMLESIHAAHMYRAI
ncbi:putative amidoligase enzyme-domain-containing protein [Microdochium trichocladiopsis]|uniref:Amidoligase enzyme-domain-containing protein n=1 Tax=Microdochium trichocladiopsis TaxID=1682393 RepID=A0A9P8YFK2_9PEZI|nr:putative amidoligase enzyme-domain-containing protein [Microdochium trichocladiopsis]KAH7036026.1 putative amidoligase enzyme-domain-containing protein [Microdochium trichocladiopsis]